MRNKRRILLAKT